jgi:hypothetical protein
MFIDQAPKPGAVMSSACNDTVPGLPTATVEALTLIVCVAADARGEVRDAVITNTSKAPTRAEPNATPSILSRLIAYPL